MKKSNALLLGSLCLIVTITAAQSAFAAAPGSVIFRLDDVQDYYASNGTKAVMDLFLNKKIPLTTGVIASAIGNDSSVVSKTAQGIKAGLFEMGLHGYNHVDFAQLTPANQSAQITSGNLVIKRVFGLHPFVFVPPFDTFNNATLKAMRDHDMSIISSTRSTETREDGKRDLIYNAADSCSAKLCPTPVHISAGGDFRTITTNGITQQTNDQIMAQIADNVKKYGYSLLVLHPQDFIFTNAKTGKVIQDKVEPNQLAQLSTLLDTIRAKYTPTSMDGLVHPKAKAAGTGVSVSAKPKVPTSVESIYNVVMTQPRKAVILTFDDDWIGQYTNAIPILKQNGFNATFFVTCDGPTQQAPSFVRGKSPEITTWDQVLKEKEMGFDIQNHGMTHHSLVDQPASVLQKEIVDSKACLESHMRHDWKDWSAKVFAAAYAAPANNATVNSYISKAGYDFARIGYGGADYTNKRYDLTTQSMNSLDKQFNHVAADILPNFADEIQTTKLPVLVYHNIAELKDTDPEWHNSTTTPETFAMEMKWLKDNGYQVHSIGDLNWNQDKKEFGFT